MEVGRNWEKREGKHNQDILSEGKAVFNNLKKREKGRHGIPAYRRLKKKHFEFEGSLFYIAICKTTLEPRPHRETLVSNELIKILDVIDKLYFGKKIWGYCGDS